MKTVIFTSIEDLIYTFNDLPNSWIFRGQADADWEIESSLERLIGGKWSAKEAKGYEEWSYDEFKSRFHLYDQENRTPTSKLAWLSAMQHYGVPTRLVDFTASPYVALYFALESYQPRSGKDFAVFGLDYTAAMDKSFEILRNEVPGFSDTRQGHRNRQDEIFEKTVDPQSRDVVWVTEPTELNKRLDRQSGCFVLSGNRAKRLMEVLSDAAYSEVTLEKYLISTEFYEQIYALLRKMNINSRTLYGDLAGLGQSIRMEMQAHV